MSNAPELQIKHYSWGRGCGHETRVTWKGKTFCHWSPVNLWFSKRGALRKWRKYCKLQDQCEC